MVIQSWGWRMLCGFCQSHWSLPYSGFLLPYAEKCWEMVKNKLVEFHGQVLSNRVAWGSVIFKVNVQLNAFTECLPVLSKWVNFIQYPHCCIYLQTGFATNMSEYKPPKYTKNRKHWFICPVSMYYTVIHPRQQWWLCHTTLFSFLILCYFHSMIILIGPLY